MWGIRRQKTQVLDWYSKLNSRNIKEILGLKGMERNTFWTSQIKFSIPPVATLKALDLKAKEKNIFRFTMGIGNLVKEKIQWNFAWH